MTEKRLFEIALKHVDESYSLGQMLDGDDLYKASREDKNKCAGYYSDITRKGTDWAYEHLKNL